MTTNIGEPFEVSIFAAHDNGGLTRDVEDSEVAWLRKLRHMTRKDPIAIDNAFDFQLIDIGVRVKTLIQGIPRLLIRDEFDNRTSVLVKYSAHYLSHDMK